MIFEYSFQLYGFLRKERSSLTLKGPFSVNKARTLEHPGPIFVKLIKFYLKK
jgi:hypothetical protein